MIGLNILTFAMQFVERIRALVVQSRIISPRMLCVWCCFERIHEDSTGFDGILRDFGGILQDSVGFCRILPIIST